MTTQKLKDKVAKNLKLCDKCGSVMIQRIIIENDSKEPNLVKIFQCIVCRHWSPLD